MFFFSLNHPFPILDCVVIPVTSCFSARRVVLVIVNFHTLKMVMMIEIDNVNYMISILCSNKNVPMDTLLLIIIQFIYNALIVHQIFNAIYFLSADMKLCLLHSQ